jgi:hypothetical protein
VLGPAELQALRIILPALIETVGDPGEPKSDKVAKARKQAKAGRPPRQTRRG